MKRILFTLFCFTLCAGISSAQESAEKELLRYKDKEIETLNENIKKLEGIIDGLQDKIKTLKKDSTKLKNNLEDAESNAGKFLEERNRLKIERDSLKKELNNLNKSHPAKLEADRLRKDSAHLAITLSDKDVIIKSLQQELADLKAYKEQFIADLSNGVEKKWLNCLYSDLSKRQQELNDEISLYERFDSQPQVKIAYNKLKKLKEELDVYIRVQHILNEGVYNKDSVDIFMQQTKCIIQEVVHDEKKKEIEILYDLLSKYTDAVIDFKSIIDANYKSSAKDAAMIKNRLEKRLSFSVESVKQIPWLSKLFEKYVEQVAGTDSDNDKNDMTNPENKNTIAHQIYKLRTQ